MAAEFVKRRGGENLAEKRIKTLFNQPLSDE
jgi:hypothetical protein